jgi:hypothetical protein
MTTETSGDARVAAGSAADWWEAGFEMGRLDQQLAARVLPDRVGLTIRRVNRGGAEVIARRRGYALHVQDVEEPGALWAEFWPVDERP